MAAVATHLSTHLLHDVRGIFLIGQEADILIGSQAHHHAEAILLRRVEQ